MIDRLYLVWLTAREEWGILAEMFMEMQRSFLTFYEYAVILYYTYGKVIIV